jgi:predicted CoA-binding protein
LWGNVYTECLTDDEIKVEKGRKFVFLRVLERLAKERGIKVVYNRCMLQEHERLFKS